MWGGDAVKIVGISEKSRKLKPQSHRVLSVHLGGVSFSCALGKGRHPEIVCGGSDAMKIVGISEKSLKLKPQSCRVLSVHISGVLCSPTDLVRCASVKGKAS